MSLTIHPFFEPTSGSYSFVVANPQARCCAIIDAALGIVATPKSHLASHSEDGSAETDLNTDTADLILDWAHAHQFVVRWILDTHIHADRPSASGYLKSKLLCATTAIGAKTPGVQGYDLRLNEGDKICLGDACGRVMETPGHTPGCLSYQFEDAVFVGDTLFMPDTGTARCDFPGGDAARLLQSIQRLLNLPGETRLYVCHDYGGDGRRHRYVTTVAEEAAQNIHVGTCASVKDFVATRTARDETLAAPRWSNFSIPANMRCSTIQGIKNLMVVDAQSKIH